MTEDNKEAKKEEIIKKQEARKLTDEELEQVTGGKMEKKGVLPVIL